ncbi:conserved hypothetical protein [Perkinsus marinus ATCC 50983]|uniref:Uncharacterized protein n=1 Tax=Perkinsus marinus (strain ATCC 50983 / TXsc) TaxID=423536 RepID=C5KHJ9_PERM5|nr:conserved hypothetical protein [Perkinsus marinus ATCC 50983]EER16061.1 conserved hypothetical protein [Perkinsus marinus ATCC 50983]|eukprot:XP_002784265.1 conserved hypothetical protein [Perkinsus marinus ATCC 50983]
MAVYVDIGGFQQNVKRAATDGALALEATRAQVTLHFLINDVFMTFFFGIAMVEIVVAVLPGGSLSPVKKAIVPLMGTLGGILGPITVFFVLMLTMNALGGFDSSPHDLSDLLNGWGIVVATDISIAWLVASFVFGGGHAAIRFLLLLAVADDVGGVLIIAFFYPSDHKPEFMYLLLCVAGCAVAFLIRTLKLKHWAWYVFLGGPLVWYGLLEASVHASLALCLIVPFMPKEIDTSEPNFFVKLWRRWRNNRNVEENTKTGSSGSACSQTCESSTGVVDGPLEKFDHDCAFFVHCGLFFFALANAGVKFGGESIGLITLAITVSLIVGKTVGIFVFGWIASTVFKFGLPDGMTVKHLFVVGIISGVGLTVALFVAQSAYTQPDLLAQAKLGALLSAVCAPIAIVTGRLFRIVRVAAGESSTSK